MEPLQLGDEVAACNAPPDRCRSLITLFVYPPFTPNQCAGVEPLQLGDEVAARNVGPSGEVAGPPENARYLSAFQVGSGVIAAPACFAPG